MKGLLARVAGLLKRPASTVPVPAPKPELKPYGRGGFTVSVLDMWDYPDDDCMVWVDGFPTFEAARDYARKRARESVESLRKRGMTARDLRQSYGSFGECCSVMVEGPNGLPVHGYHSCDELDDFIAGRNH